MSQTAIKRIKRFSPLQRLFHVVLMITFLIQGATGLARLYMQSPWGQWLASLFGGYDSCLTVHKNVGVFMILVFLLNILYLVTRINFNNLSGSLTGPDSLLPGLQDIRDFFRHIGWFLGLSRLPKFDRWGYWEKFDYWAVFWGMVIIGLTGLALAYPLISTDYMPGWGLNVALWIHRIEAFLAMAHVFIIHFFIAHLRRHNFPMDRTIFEGSADLNAVKSEKPDWILRLKNEGKYDEMLVNEAIMPRRIIFYIFGYAGVGMGLFLLIGALLNTAYISW